MTIWIVSGEFYYEGSRVLGVFCSEAQAHEAKKAYETRIALPFDDPNAMSYDYIDIDPHRVEDLENLPGG